MSGKHYFTFSSLILLTFVCGAYSDIDRGLTPHFIAWLKAHNYESYDFPRADLVGGAYGGKSSDSDTITNIPVVFIHGNTDIAVGVGQYKDWQTGFTKSIEYFLSKGYKKSEMYITTWGNGDPNQTENQVHSYDIVNRLRKFVEAVLDYTGAEKVHIIGHSMGVTLGRKIIQGGKHVDGGDLGPSLANRVRTFVGLAGANWGLVACYTLPMYLTCNKQNGFYPGYAVGPLGLSTFLYDINHSGKKEGDYVFSIFSIMDDLIGAGDLVWGRYTSSIPGETNRLILKAAKYTHIGTRDLTVEEQYLAITTQKLGKNLLEEEFLAINI